MKKNTFLGENITWVMFLSLSSPFSKNIAEGNLICVLSEVMHCYKPLRMGRLQQRGLLRQN
jgi:hypothetical protein